MPAVATYPALDAYITALSDSAQRTQRAEDRRRYQDHLAEAALLFHYLHHENRAAAEEWVRKEQRSYGTDFLAGDAGASAEAAFVTFAEIISTL